MVVCLFYSPHLVSYLTINQQFGHEARENHNGQSGDVVCEWTSFLNFEGIDDEGTEDLSNA